MLEKSHSIPVLDWSCSTDFDWSIVGVLTGIGLAKLISIFNGTPVSISIPAMLLSVLFSMAIGIIFGLLPSYKAANLDPIEALRHE